MGSCTDWVERAVDTGAASLFAAAMAYVLSIVTVAPALGVAVPALAFAGCFYGLRALEPATTFTLNGFDATRIATLELDELVLTGADRLDAQELLLDNPLAPIARASRVVRLFDPSAMPTPRDGKESIAPDDAAGALLDALAELRRSLR